MKSSLISSSTPWSKNYLINGNYDFWQRGTSFATLASGKYSTDRFRYDKSGTMVHTVSRSTDVPTLVQSGSVSSYSMLLTPTTAQASIGAGDYCYIIQSIEGLLFRPLQGKLATLSFWVKAAKTGIYCVAFKTRDNGRSFVKEYTISSANTWEKKIISIPFNDSANGTYIYDTGVGINVIWAVAAGTTFRTSTIGSWVSGNYIASTNQVNGVDNTANTFQIAQVMLNEGPIASPFGLFGSDYMNELEICRRYYNKLNNPRFPCGFWNNSYSRVEVGCPLYPVMRSTPALSFGAAETSSSSGSHALSGIAGTTATAYVADVFAGFFVLNFVMGNNTYSGLGGHFIVDNPLNFNAEL